MCFRRLLCVRIEIDQLYWLIEIDTERLSKRARKVR